MVWRRWAVPGSLEEVSVRFAGFVHFHFLHAVLVKSLRAGRSRELTILKVFSSSLICCASMGVKRLHVAISPRRSYSVLDQASWNWMRGLNEIDRTLPLGVLGMLFVNAILVVK